MNKKASVLFALSIVAAFLAGCCITAFTFGFSRIRAVNAGTMELTRKINEAAELIDTYYVGDYDPDVLADMAVAAMVYSLDDPWSYYISRDELQRFFEASDNIYQGIGVVISRTETGEFLISRVYTNSPAANAGVEAASILDAVDGMPVAGLELSEVTNAIDVCIKGGLVRITVTAPDGVQSEIEITPGHVEIDPVRYEMLDGNIGLIRIENFEAKSSGRFIQAVDALVDMGARGMIFDVRNNPGGQLPELLAMLDHILPEGDIFISRDSAGNEERSRSDEKCVSLPMAVLINSDSYSAAEFFAAALKDYEWAQIIGEATTGKGRAQITVGISDGSAIHISNQTYYTPGGKSLTGVGLEPDIAVDMDERSVMLLYVDALSHEDDTQLLRAIEALRAVGESEE